jgi:hypothetical protein
LLLAVFKPDENGDYNQLEDLILRGTADDPAIYGFLEIDIEDVENRNEHFPLLFAHLEMDPRTSPQLRGTGAHSSQPPTRCRREAGSSLGA